MQTDDFIDEYLSRIATTAANGDTIDNRNINSVASIQHPSLSVHAQELANNTYAKEYTHLNSITWKTLAAPIETQIQQTFRDRVQKIRRDLIMQDQYVPHKKFPNDQRLFAV